MLKNDDSGDLGEDKRLYLQKEDLGAVSTERFIYRLVTQFIIDLQSSQIPELGEPLTAIPIRFFII